ncbi:MAG: hypothetical protein LC751_15610 [Actinobacteria bacterium]|nr:hypothetical protein [Actinomycetota bacterium]
MQKKLRFEGMLTASLLIFLLALAEWGGSGFQSSSEAKSSVDSTAETTASSTAVTEPATGEETPPQAAHLTQKVADQIIGTDPKEAHARALQAKDAYARVLQDVRSVGEPARCGPTQPDVLGPYYVPDAPVRSSVGTGYAMSGQVLSADGCEPIPGAQLEFWLAGSQGVYDDAHRATVPAGERGEYQFQSNFPGLSENSSPRVHVRATAPGYQEMVTQHYPEAGQTEATFDLVLEPA